MQLSYWAPAQNCGRVSSGFFLLHRGTVDAFRYAANRHRPIIHPRRALSPVLPFGGVGGNQSSLISLDLFFFRAGVFSSAILSRYSSLKLDLLTAMSS